MTNGTMDKSPKWTVNGISPRVDVTGGTPVKGHAVTFTTQLGHRGEVFVPDTLSGNLGAVRDLIANQVAYIDGISQLSG